MVVMNVDRQKVMDAVARFNKRILNPFTLSFSGRPHSFYGIIQHVGRTSGRVYATPVLPGRAEDGFIIPMPYGQKVDWYRNLQAAGEAKFAFDGRAYRIFEPEVVGAAEGLRAYSPVLARSLEGADVAAFLHVKRAPLDRAAYEDIIRDYPITRAVAVLVGAVALVVGAIVLARLLRRGESGPADSPAG